jgi:hypothetical protein
MQRFTRILAEADREIQACTADTTDIEETLNAALKAAEHCTTAYMSAPPHIRRQINQGFFEKLYIGEDGSVERPVLTEPFAALLDDQHPQASVSKQEGENVGTDPGEEHRATAETDADTTDRCRPANVFRTTFGEVRDRLNGEKDIQNKNTTPPRDDLFWAWCERRVLGGPSGGPFPTDISDKTDAYAGSGMAR